MSKETKQSEAKKEAKKPTKVAAPKVIKAKFTWNGWVKTTKAMRENPEFPFKHGDELEVLLEGLSSRRCSKAGE